MNNNFHLFTTIKAPQYKFTKMSIAIPELTQNFFHILEYDSFNQFRHDYDLKPHEVSRDLSI